jgi:hypothetical protein
MSESVLTQSFFNLYPCYQDLVSPFRNCGSHLFANHPPMDTSTASRRTVALFLCLQYLFRNECGTTSRKRRRARQLDSIDDETMMAAVLLFNDGYASDSSTWSSDEEDNIEDMGIMGVQRRSINAKPRGSDSQIRRWISDPFWFSDPDFKHNMQVRHATFLHIVELVSGTVTDSVHPLTGRVRQTRELRLQLPCITSGMGGLGGQQRTHVALVFQQQRVMCSS